MVLITEINRQILKPVYLNQKIVAIYNRRTNKMRTIRIKLYKFSELSESAKQKAIEKFADINVNSDWWDSVYEDAEDIGLKITGFDIDRGSYCKGDFIEYAQDCANKIIAEHGEVCATYKTASQFLKDYKELVAKFSDGIDIDEVEEDNEYEFDNEADELEEEFRKSILEDYRIMLQNEYEYLTSEAAIIETIEVNEYEFTIDGKMN
jgi:hypothetical protein